MNKTISALFALILTLAAVAQASRYDGVELIDNHRYDDAIQLYGGRIAQNPNDAESRVLLASTYAARNGIALTKFLPAARAVIGTTAKDDDGLAQLLKQLNMVFNSLSSLPDLPSPMAMREIQTAVNVMPDLPTATYGYYLYRALLRLVLLKVDLRHRNKLTPAAGTCTVPVPQMQSWVAHLATQMYPIIEDVAKGTKDSARRTSILNLKQKIQDFLSDQTSDPEDANEVNELPESLKRLYPC